MKPETLFKRSLRAVWKEAGYWSEAYEPAHGSGTGYPDIQVLASGKLFPVELKIGEFRYVKDDRLYLTDELRPAQSRWHYDFQRHGGISALLIGVPHLKDWRAFGVFGSNAIHWKSGWVVGVTAHDLGLVNHAHNPFPVKLKEFLAG